MGKSVVATSKLSRAADLGRAGYHGLKLRGSSEEVVRDNARLHSSPENYLTYTDGWTVRKFEFKPESVSKRVDVIPSQVTGQNRPHIGPEVDSNYPSRFILAVQLDAHRAGKLVTKCGLRATKT